MRLFVVLGFVALLVFSGCIGGGESVNETYTSEYSYSVSVQPTGNLTNASFLVPVPSRDNASFVAEALVREQRRGNATEPGEEPVDRPPWSLSVDGTRYGPMLRIHADELPAEYVRGQPLDEEGDPLPSNGSEARPRVYSVSASVEVNRSIDTRDALTREPVLEPKFNVSEVECTPARPDDSDAECYSYDGRIYASYNASPGTRVDVGVSTYGDNSWFDLGWTGNTYHDFTHTEAVNDSGWTVSDGSFTEGEGNYLDSPPQ